MNLKPLLGMVCVTTLVTLACGFTIDLPVVKYTPGPTVSEAITVPFLSDPPATAEVRIEFGAGTLALAPGAEGYLISGEATYNVSELKPRLSVDGNRIRLSQGDRDIKALPALRNEIRNNWQLQFGNAPMELSIAAGAYSGDLELGGLAIQNLTIQDGAADNKVNFAQPNLAKMDSFRYETGASKVTLTGLANANFDELIFKGGAGEYLLDFSGELQHDARVSIDAGLSSLTLRVPPGTAARLSVEGGLTNVSVEGKWQARGKDYLIAGEGASLDITINLGAGNLRLQTP
jgi:hypothetical protein